MVAAAAVINIGDRIDDIFRTIGGTGACDTCVVLANQAVSAFVRTAAASVDGAHGHFGTTAICRSVSELALSLVTN